MAGISIPCDTLKIMNPTLPETPADHALLQALGQGQHAWPEAWKALDQGANPNACACVSVSVSGSEQIRSTQTPPLILVIQRLASHVHRPGLDAAEAAELTTRAVDLLGELIRRGADRGQRNERGRTAFEYAVMEEQPECLAVLLQHVDPSYLHRPSVGTDSGRLLHVLAQQHRKEAPLRAMAVLLRQAGLSLEQQDGAGHTPLGVAVQQGSVSSIRALLGAGARPIPWKFTDPWPVEALLLEVPNPLVAPAMDRLNALLPAMQQAWQANLKPVALARLTAIRAQLEARRQAQGTPNAWLSAASERLQSAIVQAALEDTMAVVEGPRARPRL